MNVDGTNQVRLTDHFGQAGCGEPAYNHDGTKIVFVAKFDGKADICVMDADGSNPTRLTINTDIDDSPTFSPDGSKIAFRSFRDGNYELYIMDSDGSDQLRLTTAVAPDF
jgi:Tol biopolymer transport system component